MLKGAVYRGKNLTKSDSEFILTIADPRYLKTLTVNGRALKPGFHIIATIAAIFAILASDRKETSSRPRSDKL